MSQAISTIVEGQTVWFEVETQKTRGSEETTSVAEKALDHAQDAFDRAEATVTSISKSMATAIRSLAATARPDEFQLELGIKITGEGRAIVAKAAAEASLKVLLIYKDSPNK